MIKPGQSSALRFLAGGVIAGLLVFLAIALSTWLYKPLTDKATVPPPSERLSEPAIAQLIADCRREQTIGYDPNPLTSSTRWIRLPVSYDLQIALRRFLKGLGSNERADKEGL